MKLSNLLNGLDYTAKNTDIEISSVAYDSRKVQKGGLFVCIKGYMTDGHKYIESAVKNGASAIVLEDDCDTFGAAAIKVTDSRKALAEIGANFYNNPANQLKIIGVTGTNGKTTTTTLIKHILEYSGKKVGLIGTNGNMIGDRVLPTERTTPESLELHELFHDMAEEGVEYVVMEVSSHSLYLSRVHKITFETAVFTNLTQDHLDFHETMENYKNAKKILFKSCRNAVVNIDDPVGIEISKECDCLTYSIDAPSDLKAENIKISARGVIYDTKTKSALIKTRFSTPGRFSVYNSLAALGAVATLGISQQKATDALLLAKGVSGRAETLFTNTDYTVILDYAHTPDGLENILNTVREFAKARVITVFGCGGDRDNKKRPIMGEIAGKLSDYCIITSDNPRCENPMSIIKEIEPGMLKTNCPYTIIESRRDAIAHSLSLAEKDDIIVLAGKGHETYQILGTEKIHFDEREVVNEILSEKI